MVKVANKTSGGFDYFFVKPLLYGNAHASARKLAGIRGVREVALTEGEYGFVVKADPSDSSDSSIHDEIISAVGGTLSHAVCHCQYRSGKQRQ